MAVRRLVYVCCLLLGGLNVASTAHADVANPSSWYISQYPPGWTRTQDCGPATVGMVAWFFGKRPTDPTDLQFISSIRNFVTGPHSTADFTFPNMETGLIHFNLPYQELSGTTTSVFNQSLQQMFNAISAGQPVIALVHGADMPRTYIDSSKDYGDHWVVVVGGSLTGTVYVNDSDLRTPAMLAAVGASSTWRNGGPNIPIPGDAFRRAVSDAGGPTSATSNKGNLVGLVVSNPIQSGAWSVSLRADKSSVPVGTTATLTAKANKPVSGKTTIRILSLDINSQVNGTVVGCSNTITCSGPVNSGSAGPISYIARIVAADGSVLAQSPPPAAQVTWVQPGWVASPSVDVNAGSGNNLLYGVAALSSSDAWAVGSGGDGNALIEHWNGAIWQGIASPVIGPQGSSLQAVTTLSQTNAWAVGATGNGNPLIEHWNGSSWGVVPTPDTGYPGNALTGISAVSADDIWAVGYMNSGLGRPLLMHWDGTQWSIKQGATGSGYCCSSLYLTGVAAVSTDDVWAIGEGIGFTYLSDVFIEHWDGTNWSPVQTAGGVSSLSGIASIPGTGNLWAVGDVSNGYGAGTFAERWDGTTWTSIPTANAAQNISNGDYNYLNAVTAIGQNDAWAVGYSWSPGASPQAIIEHWNGTDWSIVPNGLNGTGQTALYGVTSVSGNNGSWAVGYQVPSSASWEQSLIERHD